MYSDNNNEVFILILKQMKYFLQHKNPQYYFAVIVAVYFLTQFLR